MRREFGVVHSYLPELPASTVGVSELDDHSKNPCERTLGPNRLTTDLQRDVDNSTI